MRGKHTSKTLHVATRTSAPGGGALVLPSDGAGSDERQDVATHTPAQEDVAWHPSALPQLTSAAVPAGQVPSLPPCPRPYSPLPQALLPTLGPAASLLELARGLRLCMAVLTSMAPAHTHGCAHTDGCAHTNCTLDARALLIVVLCLGRRAQLRYASVRRLIHACQHVSCSRPRTFTPTHPPTHTHTHTQLLVTYTRHREEPWSATVPRPSPPPAGTRAGPEEARPLHPPSHLPPSSSEAPPFGEAPWSRWDALSGRRDGASEAVERREVTVERREVAVEGREAARQSRDASDTREASGAWREARGAWPSSPSRQAPPPGATRVIPGEESGSFHAPPRVLDPLPQPAEVCVFCACEYRTVSIGM